MGEEWARCLCTLLISYDTYNLSFFNPWLCLAIHTMLLCSLFSYTMYTKPQIMHLDMKHALQPHDGT